MDPQRSCDRQLCVCKFTIALGLCPFRLVVAMGGGCAMLYLLHRSPLHGGHARQWRSASGHARPVWNRCLDPIANLTIRGPQRDQGVGVTDAFWFCDTCKASNTPRASKCHACGRLRRTEMATAVPSGAGEQPQSSTTWHCPSCGSANWLSEGICFRADCRYERATGRRPAELPPATSPSPPTPPATVSGLAGSFTDLIGHPRQIPAYETPVGDVVVRSYPGRTQADASVLFESDARQMAGHGYHPVSQSWADGRPGVKRVMALGVFALAARPPGTLTVTYERRARLERAAADIPEKVCPRCAETIKAAALVCRFCGNEFDSPKSTKDE